MPGPEDLEALFGDGKPPQENKELLTFEKLQDDLKFLPQAIKRHNTLKSLSDKTKVFLQKGKRGIILSETAKVLDFADIHECKADLEAGAKQVVRCLDRGEDAYGIFKGDFFDPLYYWDNKLGGWVMAYPPQGLENLTLMIQLKQIFGDRFIFLTGDHDAKEVYSGIKKLKKFDRVFEPQIPRLVPQHYELAKKFILSMPWFVKVGDVYALSHTGPGRVKSLEEALNADVMAEAPPDPSDPNYKEKYEKWKKESMLASFTLGFEKDGRRAFPEKETEAYAKAMNVRWIGLGHSGSGPLQFEIDGEWKKPYDAAVMKVYARGRYFIVSTTEGNGLERPRGPDGINTYGCFVKMTAKEPGLLKFASLDNDEEDDNNYDKINLEDYTPKTQISVPADIPKKITVDDFFNVIIDIRKNGGIKGSLVDKLKKRRSALEKALENGNLPYEVIETEYALFKHGTIAVKQDDSFLDSIPDSFYLEGHDKRILPFFGQGSVHR